MPSPALNRVLWAVLLGLAALFAFGARDSVQRYWAGVGRLEAGGVSSGGTLRLTWRGRIDAPMAAEIAAAVEKNRDKARTIVLALNSPGGSLEHGETVIRLLRDIAESRRLETVVEAGGICASMCVPVYLQGQRRLAAADARFLFHEVSYREFFTSDREAVPSAVTERETDRFLIRYFEAAGVPGRWVEKIRAEMSGGHDVWKTARELVDEYAGIVQDVSE